ncbi:phospholipid-transporting ATPase VD isoform X1 [Rattus norvegicus]|nr:phospholipid-transporting ATPase VD isoform X2 [Rattus norvegicus]
MLPLVVVLTIIAIKDGLEDYRKYKIDKQINNLITKVYSRKEKKYIDCCWKNVTVGDFIRLSCNEIIPADMVLLFSTDPDGICHIETSGLDGESNLKQRQVVRGYAEQDSEVDPEKFSSRIECESPNNDLSRFRGFLEHSNKERVGLSKENLLLRGCTIRNTEAVVGIVVYAGHETKAMLNNSGPRYKRSKLERRANTDVLWCVLLLIVMCLTGALGHGIWLSRYENMLFFNIPEPDGRVLSPVLTGFYVFWTMIILLQVLIPISLYVSIEIVKLGQIYFIQSDVEFYNEKMDSTIQCRALNITEDLGQIQYLFSDKTGTLTENKMVFRRCSVAGFDYCHEENAKRLESYQEAVSEEEECTDTLSGSLSLGSVARPRAQSCRTAHSRLPGKPLAQLSGSTSAVGNGEGSGEVLHSRQAAFSSPIETDVVPDTRLLDKFSQITPQLFTRLDGAAQSAPLETLYIMDFFIALAICNTVVVSAPNQPRQKIGLSSLGGMPIKSLEEIKNIFQKLSVRRSSSPSLASGKDSTSGTPCAFVSRISFFSRTKLSPPVEDESSQMDEIPQASNSACCTESEAENSDVGLPIDSAEALDGPPPLASNLCYEAESPDEAALVYAARAYHCTLRSRTPEQVVVDFAALGPLTFQLLHILPFDSVRKRMSVVVRHPLSKQVVVYTKGADSVIMELLSVASSDGTNLEDQQMVIRERTQRHLDEYAKRGLRTLCVAKKVMSDTEYAEWLRNHFLAETSIDNREELLVESAMRLENKLTLLGATGIEDRLQEGVPESIEALHKAGIKIWMLTGDKQETAVNIAYACKLLEPDDKLFILNTQSEDACGMLMSAILEELQKRTQVSPELASPRKNFPQPPDPQVPGRAGLVITGKTLEFALQESLQKQFLELTAWCQAVICCRATPLQKSEVVKLVRNHLHVMTLAIGDGANDVSMIQVADIGIGVSGQEGMQAVMASDFAISQFRHLSKLLLVHGHWCYTRLSNMILYFFYKNVAYVNLLFWYQFFCGFSGTSMTDYWVLIFFNLLFTSVPPIIYGVLEKDVSAETLLQLPELYQSGQRSEEYLPLTFWITLLDAFYQSLVCFFVPYFTYQGSDIDIFTFGNPLNTAALLIILLHLVIESKSLTWIHMLVIVGSILSYFFFALAFGALCVTCNPPSNPYGIMQKHMLDPVFYLVCVLTTCVALLPRFVYRVLQGSVFPSPILRAKYFDRLSPEERAEALKRWRGTAKVNHVASKYASQSAAKSGRPRPGPSVAMKSATVCTIEQSTRETVLDLGYSKPGASTMTEPLAS